MEYRQLRDPNSWVYSSCRYSHGWRDALGYRGLAPAYLVYKQSATGWCIQQFRWRSGFVYSDVCKLYAPDAGQAIRGYDRLAWLANVFGKRLWIYFTTIYDWPSVGGVRSGCKGDSRHQPNRSCLGA